MTETGSFPIGARSIESWKTQDEIEDLRAYHLGHAARNVRTVLNLAAFVHAQAQMARVFAVLKEEAEQEVEL